jgi:hypothetical protein
LLALAGFGLVGLVVARRRKAAWLIAVVAAAWHLLC